MSLQPQAQRKTSHRIATPMLASLCACLVLSACKPAEPPAPKANVAASSSAATTAPRVTAASAGATPAPAAKQDLCASLDKLLMGKRYGDARTALKAAGYHLAPADATEGIAQDVAGDKSFCGNQGCTVTYASDAVPELSLMVMIDEQAPQEAWELGGWDVPECRPKS